MASQAPQYSWGNGFRALAGTGAVYRRYAIVSEADLTTAVQKLATFHAATGTGQRSVIPISEAVEVASGTVRAQSKPDHTQTPVQVVGADHDDWRPQRDSNPCYQRERLVS